MDTRGKFYDNYEDMYNNIVDGGVNYLKAYPNVKTLVIGLSGGIDSALVCALARTIINKMDRKISLTGYSLPILSNKQDEIQRAQDVGGLYCDYFAHVDRSTNVIDLIKAIDNSLYHGMMGENFIPLDTKIRVGNIKARTRMVFLYDKANKYEGLVLSTDNYTEYLLGFWTLHGDVGDFGLIQNLWKTEVYGLSEWMVKQDHSGSILQECVEAKPTDGLGVSDSDLDQLLPGWKGSYREGYQKVDEILQGWLNIQESVNEHHPVILRHLRTEFKRNNPINLTRSQLIG
jgi:NAD+ synthase